MELEPETLHLATLVLTAIFILHADHQGWRYVTGSAKTLNKNSVRRSHRLVWMGLMLMIASGIWLTMDSWPYRLSDPAFYIKMGFVLTLIINGLAIGTLSRVATERSFASLSSSEKMTLLVSGGLSAVGWIGAAIIGYFFL